MVVGEGGGGGCREEGGVQAVECHGCRTEGE